MIVVFLLPACVETTPVDDTARDTSLDTMTTDTDDSVTEHVGSPPLAPVVINEIMTQNTGTALDEDGEPADWIELYNQSDEPVSLAGHHLSDDWRSPARFTLGDDVVIEAAGYLIFWADGETSAGANHLNFELSAEGEAVGLFTPDEQDLDWVPFPALDDDVSYARLPDGGKTWAQVAVGTPGAENQDLQITTLTAVNAESEWAYHDQGIDLGTSWREPEYDDADWARGVAPLGYGDSQMTQISYGSDANNKFTTAYFRIEFQADEDPSFFSEATLGIQRDDGAAVYLNGVELARTALPDGDLSYDTLATETAGSSDETTYFSFDVDPSALAQGTNVLAAEVHQAAVNSSDLSFDATLKFKGVVEGD